MSGGPAPRLAYHRLLSRFGPQGWWPVTPRGGKTPRYRPGFRGRPLPAEAEEVCLGAILTQNTAWTNVEKALARLREEKAASLEAVAAAPERRLASWVRSSGYFRQKARKLKGFARHALARGGLRRWLASPLPALREELLGLWGVGPETADSILLYAGGRPAFVVDAYTLRVGARLGWWREADYAQAQSFLTRALPRDPAVYGEFHALIVRLAKEHCRSAPSCPGCPLREVCREGSKRRAVTEVRS